MPLMRYQVISNDCAPSAALAKTFTVQQQSNLRSYITLQFQIDPLTMSLRFKFKFAIVIADG